MRMKNAERPSLLLIALLSLSCILGIFGRSAGVGVEANTTIVEVLPAVVEVHLGERFNITVNITGAQSVYAWFFKLAWNTNTTILNATGVFEGDFLKRGGQTFFLHELFQIEGYMYVGCTLLGDVPGVSGDGTLAIVEFFAWAKGETMLDISESSYDEFDGRVIVDPPPLSPPAAANEQTTNVLGSAAVNPRPQPTQDPIWRVPQDFPTIQAAISSSSVNNGDTIHVSAGTYNENVVVSKSVNIIGQGRATTTIRALTATPTITITARSVQIWGFRIEGRFVGIRIGFVAGSTNIFNTYITNVAAATNIVGLVSFGSGNHRVIGNEIVGNVAGMLLFRSGANQIRANNVTGNSAVGTQIVLGPGGNTIYWNNFIQPAGVPNAIVWAAAANTWDNAAMQKGNYWSVNVPGWGPNMNPTNVDNFPLPSLWIPIVGDVTFDGVVNILDLSTIALAFGTKFSDTRWNPVADINGDGQVNIIDIAIAARNWQKTDP